MTMNSVIFQDVSFLFRQTKIKYLGGRRLNIYARSGLDVPTSGCVCSLKGTGTSPFWAHREKVNGLRLTARVTTTCTTSLSGMRNVPYRLRTAVGTRQPLPFRQHLHQSDDGHLAMGFADHAEEELRGRRRRRRAGYNSVQSWSHFHLD